MQVTLYEFVKRENSTKRPTTSTPSEVTGCVLKEATSIIRPTLVFTGIGNPTRFNYLYIEELGGRYYFIEDWVSVRNRWECSCTVDVLASFKTEIGNSTEYVLRSASYWDGDIVDELYPTKSDTDVVFTKAATPLYAGTAGLNGGNYVVGVITGEHSSYGAVGYYVFTAEQFRDLVDALFTDTIFETVEDIAFLKAQANPIQYVVSVKWFPEGVPVLTKSTPISRLKLGWWSVDVDCKELAYTSGVVSKEIVVPKHPQSGQYPYLKSAPYSKYSLVFMPFGELAIDPSLLYNKSKLTLVCEVDLITGIGTLFIEDSTNEPIIERFYSSPMKAYVGADIKLAQVASDFYSAQLSVVGGVASAVGSAITPSPAGVVSGIAGLVGAIGNAVKSIFPSVSTVGGTGGVNDCNVDIYLKGQFSKIVETDSTHLGQHLCKVIRISTHSVYLLIKDADFRASCTAQENVMIKDYMEGGFFYE